MSRLGECGGLGLAALEEIKRVFALGLTSPAFQWLSQTNSIDEMHNQGFKSIVKTKELRDAEFLGQLIRQPGSIQAVVVLAVGNHCLSRDSLSYKLLTWDLKEHNLKRRHSARPTLRMARPMTRVSLYVAKPGTEE
jgi:hypothetical protein